MISGYRSMIQTEIDQIEEALNGLIQIVPGMIDKKYSELESKLTQEIKDNTALIDQIQEQKQWMKLEFRYSMVMLICSYAESLMKKMALYVQVKNPEEKSRQKKIKRFYNGIKQISDDILKSLPEITTQWSNIDEFFDKRNIIAHGLDDDIIYETNITVEEHEILTALNGAYKLLRETANAVEKYKANNRTKSIL